MKILKGYESLILTLNEKYGQGCWVEGTETNEIFEKIYNEFENKNFHYSVFGGLDSIVITKKQIKVLDRGCNGKSNDYILRS